MEPTMIKGYKYRIYPNKQQKIQIAKTFGCVRFVYNHYLNVHMEKHGSEKYTFKYSDYADDLENLKSQHEWLKEVDPTALHCALKNLGKAYAFFSSEVSNHPKFKRKKAHRFSYTSKWDKGNIQYCGKHIKLPWLGAVKTKNKLEPQKQGGILNATISQEPSGKYYVSLCCIERGADTLPATDRSVGIKLGIDHYAVLSDGIKIPHPEYLKRSSERLKKLQKEMDRKKEGSANWSKARIKYGVQIIFIGIYRANSTAYNQTKAYT